MNLESVSVENSKYHRAFIRPESDERIQSPPSRNRPDSPLEPLGQPNAKRSIIDKALQHLTDQGLSGQAYVEVEIPNLLVLKIGHIEKFLGAYGYHGDSCWISPS